MPAEATRPFLPDPVDPPEEPVRWHTYREVAALLQVSTRMVMTWVKVGMLPSPEYWGSTARWSHHAFTMIQREGLKPAHSFKPAESPRSAIGAMGAAVKAAKRRPKARRKK